MRRTLWRHSVLVLVGALLTHDSVGAQENRAIGFHSLDEFRTVVVRYVRKAAERHLSGKATQSPQALKLPGGWAARVRFYAKGELRGEGGAQDALLPAALGEAVINALQDQPRAPLTAGELEQGRFLVAIGRSPRREASIIEFKGEGKELVGDLVAVRRIDKARIARQIELSKRYLLRMMDPEKHGFSKMYNAERAVSDDRLRTNYTASSLYTLLKIDQFDKDPKIQEATTPVADFLLSMQKQDEPNRGAFHYSLLANDHKEPLFPVGTAAKSIFTLLQLHRRRGDAKYLNSARLAGDWLLKMQKQDGRVAPYATLQGGRWRYGKRFSFLYVGQVLSAFSRLYRATGAKRYYEGAEKIARLFADKVKRDGAFLGDDYRGKNTISTSWVAMALLDFARISKAPLYRDIIFRCYEEILARQIDNPGNLLNHGRFIDTFTSGSGWINEVMVEAYRLCRAESREGCEKYKAAMLNTSRWLIQNTYSEQNTYHIRNPAKAIGGLIRNHRQEKIRTDAVCHGTNSLLGLLEIGGDDIRLSITEKSFKDYLQAF